MLETEKYLDRPHLRKLMLLKDFNQSTLAKAVGVEEWDIRRILNGTSCPSWSLVLAISKVLGVPSADLNFSEPRQIPSRSVRWREIESLRAIYEAFPGVNTCIECIKEPPMYLKPQDMLRWSFRRAQETAGWICDEIASAIPIIEARQRLALDARANQSFLHCVICPELFFSLAFRNNDAWFSELKNRLSELDGRTLLGLISNFDWPAVERIVGDAIGQQFGRDAVWYKVAVFDDAAAVVRLKPDLYLLSCHAETVRAFAHAIRRAAIFVPYDFPLPSDGSKRSSRQKERDSATAANERLDSVVKLVGRNNRLTGPGKEEAYWRQLAFRS